MPPLKTSPNALVTIKKTEIDLTDYGLPGISFQAEKVDYDPSKPSKPPKLIKITFLFSDASASKFENINFIE